MIDLQSISPLTTASGIYCITCIATGDCYIGRSVDIEIRWKQHRQLLSFNNHHNHLLNNAWHQYGSGSFEFSVIELCDKDMLICREGYWIDKLKPALNLNFPQYGMWEIHAEATQMQRRKRLERQLFPQWTETVDASFFEWRLPVLMADREIDYKELAKVTGMHPGTISKLKNNLPDRLELVTLMKLCKALKCQPGDLLAYIPGEGDDL